MSKHPRMAALIHNSGMEPTIAHGSVAIAEYPALQVQRWQVIAYRSQLTLDLAVHIAGRDSAKFSAMGEDRIREFYAEHFDVFGALRIHRVGRVVALGGETVELKPDGVHIDGQLERPPRTLAGLYSEIPAAALKGSGPVAVPDHQIFVLQDNLVQGHDSRTLGTIKLTSVVGTLHDLVGPDEVRRIINGEHSNRVPADLVEDLTEQHGPPASWFPKN